MANARELQQALTEAFEECDIEAMDDLVSKIEQGEVTHEEDSQLSELESVVRDVKEFRQNFTNAMNELKEAMHAISEGPGDIDGLVFALSQVQDLHPCLTILPSISSTPLTDFIDDDHTNDPLAYVPPHEIKRRRSSAADVQRSVLLTAQSMASDIVTDQLKEGLASMPESADFIAMALAYADQIGMQSDVISEARMALEMRDWEVIE